jgi:hypothetical protein
VARVYQALRLHVNFFQPVQRLLTKSRQGARVCRVHDRAQTPFQRLCAAGVLTPDQQQRWHALYETLNPLRLRRQIDGAIAELWRLAVHEPAPATPASVAGSR